MTVNKRIRRLRQTFGITQTDFSKAIYVSNGYTAKIENGRRIANDRIIRLVCPASGANEQWLKTGEGEMFRASLPVNRKSVFQAFLTNRTRNFRNTRWPLQASW